MEHCRCWECSKRAEYVRTYYSVKHGFHSEVYFCDDKKCLESFAAKNRGKLTFVDERSLR